MEVSSQITFGMIEKGAADYKRRRSLLFSI